MTDPAQLEVLNRGTEEITSWALRIRELISEIESKLEEMRRATPVPPPDPSLN